MTPRRGEVWLVDLGMTAEVRPAVVISIPVEEVAHKVAEWLTVPDDRGAVQPKFVSTKRVVYGHYEVGR